MRSESFLFSKRVLIYHSLCPKNGSKVGGRELPQGRKAGSFLMSASCWELWLPLLARCRVKMITRREVKFFISTEDSASWRIFFILYLSTACPVKLTLCLMYCACRRVLDTGWKSSSRVMEVLLRMPPKN